MGVSKKGKRKLVHRNVEYYWYMKITDDWMYAYNKPQLHIVSEDKKLLISYQPKQQNENPFLLLKGENIPGVTEPLRSWRRVKVPEWKDDEITPGFVSALLDWCYDETKQVVLVDYLGRLEN